jgi:hypothetical protein
MTFYGSDYTQTSSGSYTGDVPPYKPFGVGACGQEPVNKNYFVALNANAYAKGACGECAKVTYAGKCVVVPIVDLCPTCGGGRSGIDVSLQAFGDLVGGTGNARNLGLIKVNFEIVKCPKSRAASGSTSTTDVDPCSGESAPNQPETTTTKAPAATPTSSTPTSPTPTTSTTSIVTGSSSCSHFGFPCCQNPDKVPASAADKNGWKWGWENNASCIVSKN